MLLFSHKASDQFQKYYYSLSDRIDSKKNFNQKRDKKQTSVKHRTITVHNSTGRVNKLDSLSAHPSRHYAKKLKRNRLTDSL